ncbi:MAG: hypothetical protein IT560_14615 [Alphaproteobacteria bacterium]|nr:hypothetical protein [Alphaproteobacteria bacterium]
MKTPDDIAQRLKDMAAADLRKRDELVAAGTLFDGYHPEMEALHISHAKELDAIIDAVGWPHQGIAGAEGAAAAWLIAQHAISLPDFQRRVLQLLKDNVNDVEPAQVAMLEDRIRKFEGKPQLYGTQFDWDDNGQLSAGAIEDAANVDQRRAAVGLNSLSERTEEMRNRAASEGDKPPADMTKRRRDMDAWAKKAGWR